MHLPQTGVWDVCPMQVLYMRPGGYALGSAKSRGAARSLLEARKRDEPDRSNGGVGGLAEAIRAARMRHDARPLPELYEDRGKGGMADCLAERIRQARERVGLAQGSLTRPGLSAIAGGCQSRPSAP